MKIITIGVLLIFSCRANINAHSYEVGSTIFRNGYKNYYSGSEEKTSDYMNGIGIIARRLNFKDSIIPLFRNIEVGFHYYQGNGQYTYGNHYGTDWEKVNTSKIMATAVLYPINIRMFQKKLHLSFGGVMGGFIFINTSGTVSRTHVKDTTIPSIGHITGGYQVKEQYLGKTKYDSRFVFGLCSQLDQTLYSCRAGTLKAGFFVRYFLTPEFSNLMDLYSRQYGLQLSWMFISKNYPNQKSKFSR